MMKSPLHRIACLASAVMIASLAAAPSAGASGLEQLRMFIAGAKSGTATFAQRVSPKGQSPAKESTGTFVFQRPGKFRWAYEKPYEQLIVGDGAKLWIYDRDLNQVIVRKLDAALGATPAALLAGDNTLERNFTLTEGAGADGLEYVDAVPKTPESQFTRVRIGFRDGLPRAMELTDAFGQVTSLRFTSIERDPALAADLFRFEVPPGADVVGDAAAK
jgi:outer membrane lipoprotein carrier protein